jgi:hypothetical protein
VAAAAGLDAGLLVAGDDVLVIAERFAVERAGVEVEHAAGFGGEVRVADEDPGLVLPGLDRVVGEDPPDRGRGDRRHEAAGDGLVRQVRAAPPGQGHREFGGQLAGHRFDLGDLHGCEPGRAAGTPAVGQAGQALVGVAAAPVAHGVDVHLLPGGDLGV